MGASAYHNSAGNQGSLDHNKLASTVRSRAFGLPRWYRGSIETISHSGNNPPSDELWKTIRCTLDDSANNHDRGTDEDGATSAKYVPSDLC